VLALLGTTLLPVGAADREMYIVGLIILVALAFDFCNGFHDSANSIATLVATRVLPPHIAVIWGAFFNFAAVFVLGLGVAKTIATSIVEPHVATKAVVLAALLGAIAWDLITWWTGIPSSSSTR
jgi:inorganic phosphate transporter, PiT family